MAIKGLLSAIKGKGSRQRSLRCEWVVLFFQLIFSILTRKVSRNPYGVAALKEQAGGKAACFQAELRINGTGK